MRSTPLLIPAVMIVGGAILLALTWILPNGHDLAPVLVMIAGADVVLGMALARLALQERLGRGGRRRPRP